MKKLNYLNLAMMALCTGFSFTSCGEEEEPTSTIDPVISPQEWVTDEYTGTTFTDLDSRGMVMHIDTTYNQEENFYVFTDLLADVIIYCVMNGIYDV